jgi:hypothetical protein
MLRSSHDACGCSTQTTSTINLKRSTLHPHEGQADRPNTPSDSVNHGSNPGPSAINNTMVVSRNWSRSKNSATTSAPWQVVAQLRTSSPARISTHTLRLHFRDELDTAAIKANQAIALFSGRLQFRPTTVVLLRQRLLASVSGSIPLWESEESPAAPDAGAATSARAASNGCCPPRRLGIRSV